MSEPRPVKTSYCPTCKRYFRFGPNILTCPACLGPTEGRRVRFDAPSQAMPRETERNPEPFRLVQA